jgi:hypothetical protein
MLNVGNLLDLVCGDWGISEAIRTWPTRIQRSHSRTPVHVIWKQEFLIRASPRGTAIPLWFKGFSNADLAEQKVAIP